MRILRGLEVKRVKSHIKVAVLSVHLENGKGFVLTVFPERSYSSEVKVGERIIHRLLERGFVLRVLQNKPLLANKAYDSVRFIELVSYSR